MKKETKIILLHLFSQFSYPFNVHILHGYFGYSIMVILALHTYAILITNQAGFFSWFIILSGGVYQRF